MLDLDALRERASLLSDEAPTAVSGRWMRQVLQELTEARAMRAAALDFRPAPAVAMGVDLAGPAGSFTALVSRGARGRVENVRRV